MKSRLYLRSRYKKSVKSTNGLTRYVNICKISNFLPYCQFLNLKPVLDYNIINLLDLPSDNYKYNISLIRSNNNEKKIRLADIDNNEEDIRLIDIDKQRLATLN